MKLVTHGHWLCSALYVALWYKTLVLEKREQRASTKENSGQWKTESVERETMVVRPGCKIEVSALFCISSVEDCQPVTAAKCAAHFTVVNMVSLF